jgi:hypothetical protein
LVKGQSGNPLGRAKGSRNKATLISEQMMEEEGPNIVRTAIDMAVAGNPMMIKLCLERIMPVRKERATALELPKVERSQDVPAASSVIWAAVGEGTLTVIEANMHFELLERHKRTLEMAEHKARMEAMGDPSLASFSSLVCSRRGRAPRRCSCLPSKRLTGFVRRVSPPESLYIANVFDKQECRACRAQRIRGYAVLVRRVRREVACAGSAKPAASG